MEPETAGDRLERAILGEGRVFTALEVAEETGVTVDQLRRLWRALGFPEHGLEVAFTKADAEAVSRLSAIVETGVTPGGDVVEFRRVGYDIDRTQRQMLDLGLPGRLADRLRYGR